jgi:hypothetical protein
MAESKFAILWEITYGVPRSSLCARKEYICCSRQHSSKRLGRKFGSVFEIPYSDTTLLLIGLLNQHIQSIFCFTFVMMTTMILFKPKGVQWLSMSSQQVGHGGQGCAAEKTTRWHGTCCTTSNSVSISTGISCLALTLLLSICYDAN